MAETSVEAGTQPRAASPDSDAAFIAALLELGPVECPNCSKELTEACVAVEMEGAGMAVGTVVAVVAVPVWPCGPM